MAKLWNLTGEDIGVDGIDDQPNIPTGDMVVDSTEIQDIGNGVDNGVESLDELDNMQEQLDEHGDEELPPIAAECYRKQLSFIMAGLGMPASVRADQLSAESIGYQFRTGHTASEGIGDKAKEVYRWVLEAFRNLRKKFVDFWNKYFSSLGRAKKALESTRDRLNDSSGKIQGNQHIEKAPGWIKSAFPGKEDITASSIEEYINSHYKASEAVPKASDDVTSILASTGEIIKTASDASKSKVQTIADFESIFAGRDDKKAIEDILQAVFVTGVKVEREVVDEDREKGWEKVKFKFEKIDDYETDIGVVLSTKDKLKTMISRTLEIINRTIRWQEKVGKINEATAKFIDSISKLEESFGGRALIITNGNNQGKSAKDLRDATIEASKQASEHHKKLKRLVRYGFAACQEFTKLITHVFSLNTVLAKAVIGYTNLCIKNYK